MTATGDVLLHETLQNVGEKFDEMDGNLNPRPFKERELVAQIQVVNL